MADTSMPSAPRLDHFPSEVAQELVALYRRLGGTQKDPRLRPGAWDLSFHGVLVELDEELHFNRYRLVTIKNRIGAITPWASSYLNACVRHEPDCLRAGRWGARWTSRSSANMFGQAAEAGSLDSPGGAPRWKQRAMYDAMKDAAATSLAEVRVARLSVWDDVAGARLGDALEGRATVNVDELSHLLATRSTPAR